MTKLITLEDAKQALPLKKGSITQEAIDIINNSVNDPEFQGESLLKSAAIYENVIKGTRASIPEFLNAIKFCAYMTTNESNYTEAYKRVFIERKFVRDRMSLPKGDPVYAELTSAASRYRRTKLVVDLLTASQVPLDLIFTGYRYKAIGVLADIMVEGKYDRDRVSAAKELLAATKNENTKIELEIGPSAGAVSMQVQLDKQLTELALNQKKLLEAGYAIKDVQKVSVALTDSDVIEGEVA